MQPADDLVCMLLETPFSRWTNADKKNVLEGDRPQPELHFRKQIENKQSGKKLFRNFKISWYADFPWLCGSYYLQKLFCWPCLLVSLKKTKHHVWNKTGFESFINATRSFHKHEDSSVHMKCAIRLKTLQQNLHTGANATKENDRLRILKFNANVTLNRQFLKLPIAAVLYLSKQQLPFGGRDDSISAVNGGNFKELLKLLITASPVLIQNHYSKIKSAFSGDSKDTQNELIACISEYIQDYIHNEISAANFFSMQIDGTSDIAQKSQCSVIIRYVNSGGTLVERFLGFHDVCSDRSAENLFAVLEATLDQFHYNYKLIGQCYDGASVMPEHLNGLQQKIKERAPQAVFVHSLSHRLDLVLQQSFTKISACRIFFANITCIPEFFHHPTKQAYVMGSVVGERIRTATDTRWSSNMKLLSVVVNEWDELKNIFEQLIHDPETDATTVRQSEVFLNTFNDFEFTFLAHVFNEIFEATNILFEILPKKSLNINFCVTQMKETYQIITNKRNKFTYTRIFETALGRTEMPGNGQHANLTEEDLFESYKALFFEIIDHVLMELNVRFQDMEKLQFLCLADSSKFEQYAIQFPVSSLSGLQTCYPDIMKNIHRLKNELEIIYSDTQYRNLSLQRLIQLLQENDTKEVLKESYKLFSLILTIPSTSVSVDRSFSCLESVKTYLSNTVSQEKHPSLASISIEEELLNDLLETLPFYDDVIDKFAALDNRKIELVYRK